MLHWIRLMTFLIPYLNKLINCSVTVIFTLEGMRFSLIVGVSNLQSKNGCKQIKYKIMFNCFNII